MGSFTGLTSGLYTCSVTAIIIFLASSATQAQQPTPPSSGDTLERARQVLSLVESKEPDATSKLMRALADSHWYVRAQAGIALGRRGERSATAELVRLLESDNWLVRDSAIVALAGVADASAASLLEPLLRAPDPYLRARAAATLGRINNSAATEALIRALDDEEDQVKRAVATALGEMKAPQAVDPLLKLIQEEKGSPTVRIAAAAALGRIGDRRATPVIEKALGKLGDASFDAWQLAAALHRLGNRDFLSRISEVLKSEFADTRRAVFTTLIDLADSRALPAMLEMARSRESDPTLRLALARGLARFEGEEASAALIALLDDREPHVRVAAVESLAAIERFSRNSGSDSIQALAVLLKKERSEVVIAAINTALASFDRSRVADALLSNLDGGANPNVKGALAGIDVTVDKLKGQLASEEPSDRLRAAEMLGRLGDPGAVPALIEALDVSRESPLRAKAASVLGLLKDRRAVDPLMAAARAPERNVKVAAITALGQVGDYSASDTLFEAAKDKDEAVRTAAVDALAGLGVTVERLSGDLSGSTWQVRAAALTSLARLGDRKASAMVINSFKDPDARVRVEAVRALATLAAEGDRGAVDAFISVLSDSNSDVRMQSAIALGRFKDSRAVGSLTTLLSDRDSQVNLAAAESLARMQDPRVIRLLVDSLDNADWRVRARAAQVLAFSPSAASSAGAVVPLVNAMRDKDLIVRYYASEALVAIGGEAVPQLIDMLRSERSQERARVVRVLGRIGQPTIMPLVAFIQDRRISSDTKIEAARLLGRLGDARAVDPLITLLADERYYVRREVSRALGQIGEPALERLGTLAQSEVPATREAGVEALGAISSPRALNLIMDALSDQAPGVRGAAVRALGESGSEAAVPTLMSLLRDESGTLRAQAASSLARLGKPSMSGLTTALKDPKPSVRVLAAQALGDIGRREAVPALVELIRTDLSGARGEAIEALAKIGDVSAVEPILAAMNGGSVTVRRKAIAALARLRDGRAVGALSLALTDRDVEVRQAAAAGLGELGDASVIAKLEGVAENDSSADVRAAAATAIERIRAMIKSRGSSETKSAKLP